MKKVICCLLAVILAGMVLCPVNLRTFAAAEDMEFEDDFGEEFDDGDTEEEAAESVYTGPEYEYEHLVVGNPTPLSGNFTTQMWGYNTSDVDIKLDAKSVFAVEEITWMINSIIAIIVGLLCGGSGIALMAEGLPGMIAGAVLSLLVLLIGKESIQGAVLKADIPESIRKMVPKGYFRSRLKKVSSEVKSSFYETLETEQNEAIIEQMVSDISVQIEQCLHKMAEVVEIPLG